VVPNAALFSVSNFRYYALREGLPLRFARAWDGEPVGIAYMILKSGDQGPVWTAERPRRIAERFAADPHLARVFPVIGEFPLPDGSTATVRARRLDHGPAVPAAAMARAVERAIRARLPEVARDVEGLEIRLTYDDAILRGRIRRVELRAGAATSGISHAETPRSRAFATSRSESTTSASTRSARPRQAGSIRSTPNECESSGRRSSPPTSARSSASSRASRA